MNNTVAIVLGLVLLGLIGFDLWANEGEYLIFWGRQLWRLIDWLAFWR